MRRRGEQFQRTTCGWLQKMSMQETGGDRIQMTRTTSAESTWGNGNMKRKHRCCLYSRLRLRDRKRKRTWKVQLSQWQLLGQQRRGPRSSSVRSDNAGAEGQVSAWEVLKWRAPVQHRTAVVPPGWTPNHLQGYPAHRHSDRVPEKEEEVFFKGVFNIRRGFWDPVPAT